MYQAMSYETIMEIVKNPNHYKEQEIKCAIYHLKNIIYNHKIRIKELKKYIEKLEMEVK